MYYDKDSKQWAASEVPAYKDLVGQHFEVSALLPEIADMLKTSADLGDIKAELSKALQALEDQKEEIEDLRKRPNITDAELKDLQAKASKPAGVPQAEVDKLTAQISALQAELATRPKITEAELKDLQAKASKPAGVDKTVVDAMQAELDAQNEKFADLRQQLKAALKTPGGKGGASVQREEDRKAIEQLTAQVAQLKADLVEARKTPAINLDAPKDDKKGTGGDDAAAKEKERLQEALRRQQADKEARERELKGAVAAEWAASKLDGDARLAQIRKAVKLIDANTNARALPGDQRKLAEARKPGEAALAIQKATAEEVAAARAGKL
jgi:hypothetical protein